MMPTVYEKLHHTASKLTHSFLISCTIDLSDQHTGYDNPITVWCLTSTEEQFDIDNFPNHGGN